MVSLGLKRGSHVAIGEFFNTLLRIWSSTLSYRRNCPFSVSKCSKTLPTIYGFSTRR
jgi:hypothetical protein